MLALQMKKPRLRGKPWLAQTGIRGQQTGNCNQDPPASKPRCYHSTGLLPSTMVMELVGTRAWEPPEEKAGSQRVGSGPPKTLSTHLVRGRVAEQTDD